MKIAVSDPGFFFALFYVLSFTVTYLLFLICSIRQKIRLRSVLLMLTASSLFTIIGSRLFTIPVTEWGSLISSGLFDDYTGRSAVGGLFFGLVALIFSQRFLGLDKPVLDLYSWIGPIGFGIQKIGCLLNGCCYGKPSALPWSIKYATGTNAHYNHWASGLIDENAGYSLSVHPVQLYEVICLFIIAFIVWKLLSFWKKSGSTLLFSLFLFFIFRFSVEFLRDPSSAWVNNNLVLGVRVFQWFLLIAGILFGLSLLVNEKYTFKALHKRNNTEPSLNQSIVFILVLSVIIYIFRGLFTPFELVSLEMNFIPAILFTLYYIYKSITVVRIRVVTASFLVFPLFLLSQANSPDSLKTGQRVNDFYKNEVKSYKRGDFGISAGSLNNEVYFNPQKGSCGTTYTQEDYKHVFQMAGAGFSTVTGNDKSITSKGINLFGGVNRDHNLTTAAEKSYFLFGASPYIIYDRKWIGIGIGAHIGNLRWAPLNPSDQVYFGKGTIFSPVMPAASFRLGRPDIINVKYTYGFNFPAPFPVLTHELSIGTGFGKKTDYSLRYGILIPFYEQPNAKFFSFEGRLNKQIGLNLKYTFVGHGAGPVDKSYKNLLFGANYRFGFNK